MVSLRQIAKELGVSHSYLSQIRHGKRPASDRVVSRVVSMLEPSLTDTENVVLHRVRCYNLPVAGESSSGRTADSGSVSEGSNPSSPARKTGAHSSSG